MNTNNENTIVTAVGNNQEDMVKKIGLHLINAAKLNEKILPPTQFVVQGMLTAGCCLLAAGHKAGKSWLSLQLTLAVAGGKDFMNLPTQQGRCLYCALEDSEGRLQSRMRKVLGGSEASQYLDFVTEVPRIGKGLEGALENYLKAYPDTKLIVIDTFALVRGEKRRGESDYDYDYREVHTLKKIADKYRTCILLIHHTRKMRDIDVFNEISGGVGIQAGCDIIMAMKKKTRTDPDAILHVTGRDVEADEMGLHFDSEKCLWSYVGNTKDLKKQAYENNLIVTVIRELLSEQGSWQGTMSELLEIGINTVGCELAKSTSALSKMIAKLEDDLLEMDNIKHIAPNPNGGVNGRIHSFSRVEDNVTEYIDDEDAYYMGLDDEPDEIFY